MTGTRIGAATLARGDGGRAGERAVRMERAGGLEQWSRVDCRFGELGCCEERGSSVEGRSLASVGQLGDVVPFVREMSSLYSEVGCEH